MLYNPGQSWHHLELAQTPQAKCSALKPDLTLDHNCSPATQISGPPATQQRFDDALQQLTELGKASLTISGLLYRIQVRKSQVEEVCGQVLWAAAQSFMLL